MTRTTAALMILLAILSLVSGAMYAQTSGSNSPIPVNEQVGTGLTVAPTISGANAAASVPLAGARGQRICIRGIYVKATGAAATSTLTVSDGATIVLDFGTLSIPLLGIATAFVGAPLVCGSPSNSMTVDIGAGGALAITTTSVVAERF